MKVLDVDLEAIGRAAALDGGLRLVAVDPRRRHGFIDTLLKVDVLASPVFSRWFAKIVGVVHSFWPDESLKSILELCSTIPESADEATFELAMSSFASGMACVSPTDAKNEFTHARKLFVAAEKSPGERPDAVMYALCLQILIDFYELQEVRQSDSATTQLAQHLVALNLYHRSESDPPWLRARTAESILWQKLVDKLMSLDTSLSEPGWFEPAAIIENELMPIYRASRAILRRNELGGIESLIQPRIVGCISDNASFAHVLKTWLRQNQSHKDAAAVSELLTQVADAIGNNQPRVLHSARMQGQAVANFLAQTRLSCDDQKRLGEVFMSTLGTWQRSFTSAQVSVLCNCIKSIEVHPDYQGNPDVRDLCNSITLWLTGFASTRLEWTKGDEPALKYLFKSDDGKKPLEFELQRDFVQFLTSCVPGTKIEVTNVGGGRADVYVQLGAEKLVVEVKRESIDCSFDGLTAAYAGQTFDYQNTSSRLGFMLVLDQTDRGGAAMHLSDLFKVIQMTRANESQPRSILIVKIPGERLSPSGLSKKGKADLGAKRKSQRVAKRRNP
ncbi:hypothetical protein [Crateriforma spongiae]|uniref:hypothetical protein n=1 Tax=Crateriforma spongiae TaxID=2724528 RepID=UPI001445FD64|nr:hypothetical protein [Crateriforma spongiae]